MNTKPIVWCSLLALASPMTGQAQGTAQPPLPRWFVGVGGAWGSYQEPARTTQYERFGPAAAVGWYLTPRLAVQAGLAFYQQTDSFSNPGSPMLNQVVTSTERRRAFTVPVLLRYGLRRAPATGWQLDALAGASWLHTQQHAELGIRVLTPSGPALTQYAYTETFTGANLTAGLGLRRALGRHLELTLDALGHLSMTPRRPLSQSSRDYPYSNAVPPLEKRLTGTVLLGLRYRFGAAGSALPRPAPTPQEP